MNKWNEYKIKEIISLEYGKALNGYDHNKGRYKVFGTNGKIGSSDSYIYDKPSIIIGRKGAYRGVHYSKFPFFVIDTAFYTKNRIDELDTLFLYYWFKNIDINSMDSGSAIPSTNREDVYDLDIQLPHLQEQKTISSVLSGLDDKIDLLHRQNETLEAMAETLFRQWFVEEANESWEEKRFGEILTITSSKRIFYSEYVANGIPFYRSKEIIELRNVGRTNSELFITEERFSEIDRKYGAPKEGDILMTSVGTLGVPYRVKKYDKFYFKDGNLTWFKDFKTLPSSVVYYWLNSKYGQEQLSAITIGSTQEALTIEGLKSISIKCPPEEKVIGYKIKFDSILKKMESNQTQINILKSVQEFLLPKLLNGEIRVKI